MIRNIIIAFFLIAFVTGPLIAIGAAAASDKAGIDAAKSMCLFTGIGCSQGPVIMPALGRMK